MRASSHGVMVQYVRTLLDGYLVVVWAVLRLLSTPSYGVTRLTVPNPRRVVET